MKVAVLHTAVTPQAAPDEEDVLEEVAHVCEALNRLGYEPVSLPFSIDIQNFIDRLLVLRPGFAFNLVDSVAGKGHLIHLAPALLDFLNIPYTGAGTDTIYLTSNKLLAKQWLVGSGIATPRWCRVEDFLKGGIPFPGPYIVKSVWEHASMGLDEDSVVATPDLLRDKIQRAKLGGGWFAETYIEGREFNISLLAGENGPEVLPLAEIQFLNYEDGKPRVVGYRAKWDSDSFEFRHTVRCFDFPDADHHLLEHLTRIAQHCWQVFELNSYCRVDFRVDAAGKPWVLEVNANPCISPDSGFVAAATRKGLPFDEVLARIIHDSLGRWELPPEGNPTQ